VEGALGRPDDTSPEAWNAQLAMLRRMTGQQRSAIASRLTQIVRDAARAGIRARHPEYGEEELRRAFFRMMHGDEITRRVWRDADLLDP
jgi:hypothetical protein